MKLTIGHLTSARVRDVRRLGRFLGVRGRGRLELANRVFNRIDAERLLAAPVTTLPATPYGSEQDR